MEAHLPTATGSFYDPVLAPYNQAENFGSFTVFQFGYIN
jgi:hypothetical protein